MRQPTKVLLDACVIYPTVQREMLLKTARAGLYQPLWSERILEEWRIAAGRLGPLAQAQAEGEIAVMRGLWPEAMVRPNAGVEARLYLPDPDDIHVLAAAVTGSAEILLTENSKDFPKHTLWEEGVRRDTPDHFLTTMFVVHPKTLRAIADEVWETARTMERCPPTQRAMLKKARLPRLAKGLENLDY
ncbi:MAG: PIN domain-containing protein [Pseudomonadota bacterium]